MTIKHGLSPPPPLGKLRNDRILPSPSIQRQEQKTMPPPQPET